MRRIVIIFAGLVIIAGIIGLVVLMGSGTREKPLPDGSFIRIEKVAFAKQEHFALGGRFEQFKKAVAEFWRTHVSHAPLTMRGGMSSWYMNAFTHSNEPALYIYITRREAGKGYAAVNVQSAELIDEDGCVFTPTQNGGWDDGMITTPVTSRMGNNYSVGWFRFEAFPRHQKEFRLVLYEDAYGFAHPGDHPASVEFSIANPVPPSPPANWPVEPLPITRTQDSVSFILTNVNVGTNNQRGYPYGAAKSVDADYQFIEDGQPSTNWRAVTAELYDSSGNFVSDQFPWVPCRALCPREAAWKLNVKFFGTDKSRAASNDVWKLPGLKVPAAGETARIGKSNTLQGVLVSVGAIGGVGKFTYSNGVSLKSEPGEKLDHNNSQAVSWPSNWSGKRSVSKPTFTLTTKNPHLALDLGDLSDDQKFTVCAVDEQGREYYGHRVYDYHPPGHDKKHGEANYLSNWYESEGGFILFDLPAEVKTVDLVFCVHTCRNAEFIFKPPRPLTTSAKK